PVASSSPFGEGLLALVAGVATPGGTSRHKLRFEQGSSKNVPARPLARDVPGRVVGETTETPGRVHFPTRRCIMPSSPWHLCWPTVRLPPLLHLPVRGEGPMALPQRATSTNSARPGVTFLAVSPVKTPPRLRRGNERSAHAPPLGPLPSPSAE